MRLEPKNKYEFCQAFSKITKRPVGIFLQATKGWPIDWFFQVASECKVRPPEKQAIYVNYFIKNARPQIIKTAREP